MTRLHRDATAICDMIHRLHVMTAATRRRNYVIALLILYIALPYIDPPTWFAIVLGFMASKAVHAFNREVDDRTERRIEHLWPQRSQQQRSEAGNSSSPRRNKR